MIRESSNFISNVIYLILMRGIGGLIGEKVKTLAMESSNFPLALMQGIGRLVFAQGKLQLPFDTGELED